MYLLNHLLQKVSNPSHSLCEDSDSCCRINNYPDLPVTLTAPYRPAVLLAHVCISNHRVRHVKGRWSKEHDHELALCFRLGLFWNSVGQRRDHTLHQSQALYPPNIYNLRCGVIHLKRLTHSRPIITFILYLYHKDIWCRDDGEYED